MTPGEDYTLHVHCSGVMGDRGPELVELSFGGILEIAGQLVVMLWGQTKGLLLWFPGTELFTFVVLYL